MGFAPGEPGDGGAGIAEQDPPGAVPVHQALADLLGGQASGVADEVGQQGQVGLPWVGLIRRRPIQQPASQGRHRCVVVLFLQKGLIILETVWVEQTQAPEVAGPAELLRGGGEEQDAGGAGRQAGHQVIPQAAPGLVRRPGEVMGLVHHQQVPVTGQGALGGLGVPGQQVQAAQDALLGLEGVGVPHGGETLAVEQGQAQVEAAAHFHQPLVEQGLGDQDQDPARPPGEQHPVQDEPRLDGLAEPHLIRQQDPRGIAPGHFGGDVELVWDGADARPHKPQHRRGGLAHPGQPCLQAQGKPEVPIDAP